MKRARLHSVVIAGLIGCTALALFALLDWLRLNWRPWADLLVVTSGTFGYLASVYARELRQLDCLIVFVATIALHLGVFIYLLRAGFVIPVWDYLPVVFVESLIVVYLLKMVSQRRHKA